MKFNHLLLVLTVFGAQAFGSELKSIKPVATGTEYTYQLDGFIPEQEVSFIDNDGVGTLIVVNQLLLQQPNIQLRDHLTKWEQLKDERVAGWSEVKDLISESLRRAVAYYENELPKEYVKLKEKYADNPSLLEKIASAEEASGHRLETLKELEKKVRDFPAEGPTYDGFNVVGRWIHENGEHHAYTMRFTFADGTKKTRDVSIFDNSTTNNPLTYVFQSYGPTYLPLRTVSKSRMDLDFDLKTLMKRYNELKKAD